MKSIIIINGPNLNLLGVREPDIYGSISFAEYLNELKSVFHNATIEYFQSNKEGELIDKIHAAAHNYNGIAINPGGFTHTSVAIADALKAVDVPSIEVHISNINSREEFRKTSVTSEGCDGMIAGLGLDSYKLAIEHLLEL